MFPGGAKNSQLASVFTGLALIGAGLLPGLAVHHGLFDFFEKTLKLSATRTVYTGQAAIDKELAQLISFFDVALERPGLRALTLSFAGLLGTTLTVIQFASTSSSNPIAWLLPFPLSIFCQMYGAGMAFPLLFSFLYAIGFGERQVGAKGWLPALSLSFFGAGLPMLFRLPFVDSHTRLTFCALWQAFPVTLVVLRAILRPLSPEQSPKLVLRLLGWIAFGMHSSGLVDLYLQRDKLYMLDPTSRVPGEVAATFLTFDYVMVVIATVVFVLAANPKVSAGRIAALSIVAGPGAAIAWSLADAPTGLAASSDKVKKQQ